MILKKKRAYFKVQITLALILSVLIITIPISTAYNLLNIEQDNKTPNEESRINLGKWGEITKIQTRETKENGILIKENDQNQDYGLNPAPLILLAARGGQVTVFIIIGIVILAAFGFLYKVNQEVTVSKLRGQAGQALTDFLNANAVKEYISQCLDISSKEAVNTIGRQGGIIHADQNGSLIRDDFEPLLRPRHLQFYNPTIYETRNVTYLLTQPSTFIDTRLPQYPCFFESFGALCSPPYIKVDNEDNPCGYIQGKQSECYYYQDSFLRSIRSPPSFYLPLEINNNEGNGENYISPYPSIERQLEAYTSDQLKKCANFSSLSAPYDYTIIAGNITTDVTIGENDIGFNVKFPVQIIFKNKQPIVKTASFYNKQPVRLKKIYTILKPVLADEARDVTLSLPERFKSEIELLANDTNDTSYLSFNMIEYRGVAGEEHPFDAATNDVFVIEDTATLIDGQPYIFQFARQNHYPTLDYITNNPWDTHGKKIPYSYFGSSYEIVVMEGQTIEIIPKANDPDEDTLTFYYTGWKETWDDRWDPTKETTGECSKYPQNCTIRLNVEPRMISTGMNYDARKGIVKYMTTGEDAGAHELIIHVSDNQYEDTQRIRILVVGVPNPIARGYNLYDDVSDEYASIEDPYVLDASESTGLIINYDWWDHLETTEITSLIPSYIHDPTPNTLYSGLSSIVYLLPKTPIERAALGRIENLSILNITGAFNNSGTERLEHKIELRVSTISTPGVTGGVSDPEFLIVNVTQCLPHRNQTVLSYPYHNETGLGYDTTEDQFMGNHTCCSDQGTEYGKIIESTSASKKYCFNYTEYTCRVNQGPKLDEIPNASATINPRHYFDQMYPPRAADDPESLNGMQAFVDKTKYHWPATKPPTLVETAITGSWNNLIDDNVNDVYYRQFTVECDGTRGNICNGTKKDLWIVSKPCEKCQYCEYGSAGCQNWTYNPLEKDFYICNRVKKCVTDTGKGRYDSTTGGNILAMAVCDGKGKCDTVAELKEKIDSNQNPIYSFSNNTVENNGIINSTTPTLVSVNCDAFDYRIYREINGFPDPSGLTTYSCDGTCGIGMDSCTTRDYTCVSSTIPGQDATCDPPNKLDADTNSLACQACKINKTGISILGWTKRGALDQNNFGEYGNGEYADNYECCGDDIGEYYKTLSCEGNTCNDDTEEIKLKDACCDNINDCGPICLKSFDGTIHLFDAVSANNANAVDLQAVASQLGYNNIGDYSTDTEICFEGKMWDPDLKEEFCYAVNGIEGDPSPDWDNVWVGGATDNKCCGDDPNEYYITTNVPNAGLRSACCYSNAANMCVNSSGYCQTEAGGEYSCNDGIDNDCDGLTDCADPDCYTNPKQCTPGTTNPNCKLDIWEYYLCGNSTNKCVMRDGLYIPGSITCKTNEPFICQNNGQWISPGQCQSDITYSYNNECSYNKLHSVCVAGTGCQQQIFDVVTCPTGKSVSIVNGIYGCNGGCVQDCCPGCDFFNHHCCKGNVPNQVCGCCLNSIL